jgi:DNA-binding transcriptional LysR family regulator
MHHLKTLRYVDLAARLGSIRKAADALNVASTAVNRSVLALERELGAELFERLPRGVRLTAVGELFVHHVRQVAADLDRVRSEIEDLKGLRRGTIKIAAIEGVTSSMLPEAISRFQQRYPRVQFQVTLSGTDEIIGGVVRDDYDIGIILNPPLHADLMTIAAVEQRLCAVMSRKHKLAREKALHVHQCVDYPLAIADTTKSGRHMLDQMLHRANLRITPAIVSNSFQVMESFCLEGQGIFFQIEIGARRQPIRRAMTAIPIMDRGAIAKLVIATRRGRTPTVPTAAFLEALKAEVGAA